MKTTDKSITTEISEIFSSIQGEGPFMGVKQIFVRFGRCNMHCHYCDELDKMQKGNYQNFSIEQVLEEVDSLEMAGGEHHSVSLTGGEPLMYTPFLRNLLPKLKEKGYTTYLETNGTFPTELEKVIRWCDIIAMDIKPPSSSNDRDFYKEHTAFLKRAVAKEVFVKIVVTPQTTLEDIQKSAKLVAEINPKIPFILQPMSEGAGFNTASMKLAEGPYLTEASHLLRDVRVIGQMHKIWGVR